MSLFEIRGWGRFLLIALISVAQPAVVTAQQGSTPPGSPSATTTIEGKAALMPGKHTLEFDFAYDGLGIGTLAFNDLSGIGRSGTGVLKVDGNTVVEQKMERTLPLILQWDEALDVGSDTLTGVDDEDYQPPFAFTGKIDKITLTVDRPQLTPADLERLEQAQQNNKASE